MNSHFPQLSVDNTGFAMVAAVFASIVGVATTIVWLYIGWRAMRAHERIAETLRKRAEG